MATVGFKGLSGHRTDSNNMNCVCICVVSSNGSRCADEGDVAWCCLLDCKFINAFIMMVIITPCGLGREHSRISPPRSLSKCDRKRRLNQASFVLLCFVLFAFSGLCLVLVESVFDLSSVLYFPACTDVNGTV